MAHTQEVRETFTPSKDVDPFVLVRQALDPNEPMMLICSLEPADHVLPADAPTRTIFRRPSDGKLILVEGHGHTVVQVGIGATYAEVGELAMAILSDDAAAKDLTVTPALQMLAVAYLAARAAAERRVIAERLPAAARGA